MRQVPWESWQQWHHVRCCLASASASQIAEALDRISGWQSRGGLPVAVEITANLISSQQRDPFFTAGLSRDRALPGDMLRIQYAGAIMRLVNGIVDQSVKRNTSSVANRAEDASLPRVFVDIRHETSHAELPSLSLLRHASKQALAWLETNYWEEQEQLLLDMQVTLRTKLVKHASLAFEILTRQQLLISEEGKGQDRKQQRLILKRTIKSLRRQQQSLLRELLELAVSRASDVVSLCVKYGLLVHDLSPAASFSAPCIVSTDQPTHGDEIEDSGTVNHDLEADIKQEEGSLAAWRFTIGQLSEHMPQLPALLLSSIIEFLTGKQSSEASTNSGTENVYDLSRDLPSNHDVKELLVGWATWILHKSSAISKGCKASQASDIVEMQATIPQDMLKELANKCLRSEMETRSLVKLISHISHFVSDSSFGRRASLLARCGLSLPSTSLDSEGPENEKNIGGEVMKRYRAQDSARSESGIEGCISDSTLAKARKLQQVSLLQWVIHPKVSKHVEPAKVPTGPGPWSKVKNWRPCPIGMLPSVFSSEGVLPNFDVMNRSLSEGLDLTGTEAEITAHEQVECIVAVHSATLVDDDRMKQDLKRKVNKPEADGEPRSDPKRKKGSDSCRRTQQMASATNHQGTTQLEEQENPPSREENHDTLCMDPMEVDPAADINGNIGNNTVNQAIDKEGNNPKPLRGDLTVSWHGYLLQQGVLQVEAMHEVSKMQAAIHVL